MHSPQDLRLLLPHCRLQPICTMHRGRTFSEAALNWYAGDALGLIIVVPMLLTVRFAALKRMFCRDQLAKTLLLMSAIVAVMVLNFIARLYPIAFLFFPAVLLLTFQRGFAGGAVGLAMAGAI